MDNAKIDKMNLFYFKDHRIKKNDIPDNVLFILKKLKNSGFLSFLVGGCVRDLLLKRPVRDWDILTDAKPKDINMVFSEYQTLMIGKSFQTVTIVLNHKAYQISTFRNCSNQNSHDDQGDIFQIVKDDLLYRDFTINSMAWNQDKGLLDPANGLRNLSQKVLQSIDPDIRFKEDPLRMLRAIRIACDLTFALSPTIKKSILKHAFLIHYVSPERIMREICFILNSLDTKRGISLLQQFGFERYIFSIDRIKKMQRTKGDKKKIFWSAADKLKEDLPARLALWGRLYFGSCQDARLFYVPIIKYLRFKKKTTEAVKILLGREWQDIDFSSSVKIRFLIAQFGRENTELMMSLKEILLLSKNDISQKNKSKMEKMLLDKEFQENHPVKLTDLAINGDDLIKIGLFESKKVGEILDIALEEVLLHPENNHKDYLIKFAQEMINKI